MKKIIRFLLPAMACVTVRAQSFPDFKSLRYEEHYSALAKDTTGNWYKQVKYMPLKTGSKTYVSLGGDIRFQYFNVKNESWGDEPRDKGGYTLSRYLFHADLHAGSHFRTFVQLQSSMANGRSSTSPVDENPLEVHQAFFDLSTKLDNDARITLRTGRQEMSYGSQRLISVREGPNNRQSFDAVKAMLQTKKFQADLFFAHYVAAKKGAFNDGWNKNNRFWGAYAVVHDIPWIKNIDLYYLGLWKRNAIFDDGEGRELRHSFGTRLWGQYGGWKYDAEALWQTGNLAGKKIRAWTASVNSSYTFDHIALQPTLGIKGELISGDKKSGDDRLQTFNPLFPRGAYFGLAALIGPANLIDVHPSISFAVAPHLDWTIDCDAFWRYSTHDGLYAPNVALMYSGKDVDGKVIGQQVSTDLAFAPQPYLYFRVEFTWFKTGNYLEQVSAGKDILFAGITAQLKF